jgi:hypothetical protein
MARHPRRAAGIVWCKPLVNLSFLTPAPRRTARLWSAAGHPGDCPGAFDTPIKPCKSGRPVIRTGPRLAPTPRLLMLVEVSSGCARRGSYSRNRSHMANRKPSFQMLERTAARGPPGSHGHHAGCRRGTLSAAARRLNTPAATASRKIAAFEEHLRAKLFDRSVVRRRQQAHLDRRENDVRRSRGPGCRERRWAGSIARHLRQVSAFRMEMNAGQRVGQAVVVSAPLWSRRCMSCA